MCFQGKLGNVANLVYLLCNILKRSIKSEPRDSKNSAVNNNIYTYGSGKRKINSRKFVFRNGFHTERSSLHESDAIIPLPLSSKARTRTLKPRFSGPGWSCLTSPPTSMTSTGPRPRFTGLGLPTPPPPHFQHKRTLCTKLFHPEVRCRSMSAFTPASFVL